MWRRPLATLLGIVLAASIGACGGHDPVKPVNYDPVILSLTAFPTVIGATDSVVVICRATDPDGDLVVYDWFTDSRLRIGGTSDPGDRSLYQTYENYRVFYPDHVDAPTDTAWVSCYVRDLKGGGTSAGVARIVVHQP